jgi:hypothetical protein
MKIRTTIATAIFVAFVMVVPAYVSAVEPMGMITEDGVDFPQEYYEYSAKWLSNVSLGLKVRCYHGATGTMDVWLYDPDGIERAHYTPARNTVNPTIYKYNLYNHYNNTGKISGQWHLHWHGHYDGNPIEDNDYMYVGMMAIQRTTPLGTNYNEARKLAVGLFMPTVDNYGIATSIAITLRDVSDGGSPCRNLKIRVEELFQDRKVSGPSTNQNQIEEMRIYIEKVAFAGFGTTGTGTGGSWYNSGINVDSSWGGNVTLAGGTWGGGFAIFAIVVTGIAVVVCPAAFAFTISSVWTALGLSTPTSGNPDQAPYHSGSDTSASSDFHKNANNKFNGTALNNVTLKWDYSKSLSYCYRITGSLRYYNSNPPATVIDKDLAPLYFVLVNS